MGWPTERAELPDVVEDLARRWPAVAPTYRALVRPLDVEVCGPPSSGQSTLVRAIHATMSASATVGSEGDADVTLYLLVGRVRPGDVEALTRLGSGCVVLLNKADTCGDAAAADAAAQRCAHLLATDVMPVSALWGTTSVTSADAELVREVAAVGRVPTFAAQLAADPAGRGLLRRVGRQGIVECVDAVRAGRIAGNPADLDRLLRRRSGMADLAARLARVPVYSARADRARRALAELAAGAPGHLRDDIERALTGVHS